MIMFGRLPLFISRWVKGALFIAPSSAELLPLVIEDALKRSVVTAQRQYS